MKKIFLSMLAITMAAFTFTSCEDVPEPYGIPGEEIGGGDAATAEPSGDGTQANPFNVAAAIKYIQDGGSETTDMYVKGIVVSVDKGSFDPTYGSLKYYISDNGTTSNQFRVYNGYAGPNRTKFSGEDALKPGDIVVICGKLVNYSGTLEFTTGNYVVSINGSGDFGGDSGDDQPTDGTYINETFANSFGSFTVNTVKGTPWTIDSYGYAKATGFVAQGQPATPSASYIVSKAVNMTSAKEAKVSFDYILRYVTNYDEPIAGIENKVLVTSNYTGDPTTTQWTDITGTLTEVRDWKTWTKFTADVPADIMGKNNVVFALYYACEESSGTWEVKNFTVKEGKEDGGDTPGGEVTENSITFVSSELGLTNEQEAGTITLADGTVLVFDAGSNRNPPKFYTNGGSCIRMYPNNSMTIKGSKKIASVIINCGENNGIGNASGDIKAEPGTVNTNEKVVTISNVNAQETVITDISTQTKIASQIYISSMTINYAE